MPKGCGREHRVLGASQGTSGCRWGGGGGMRAGGVSEASPSIGVSILYLAS